MNFLFYHHAGSNNHGCEALVRSIALLLSENNAETNISVSSSDPIQDYKYFKDINKIKFFKDYNLLNIPKRYLRFINRMFADTFKRVPLLSFQLRNTIQEAKNANAILSIGGDNYSYSNSIYLSLIDKVLKKHCKTSILFGCSINNEYLDPVKNEFKINNLRTFTLITARESITYENLIKLGLKNVKLIPDPAFILPYEKKLPNLFMADNTIGINISPMIQEYENKGQITLKCYIALIKYIIDNTPYDIALIPHVITPKSNDVSAIKELLKYCPNSERIVMLGDYNCMELKGFISRCKMFIGARTHASIAAYSTCVPTLVVGYSVKATGIAKDIFGTYENYVIPVQKLSEENDLIKAFLWLKENEVNIRQHLKNFMPTYCSKAYEAGKEVIKIIGDNH